MIDLFFIFSFENQIHLLLNDLSFYGSIFFDRLFFEKKIKGFDKKMDTPKN